MLSRFGMKILSSVICSLLGCWLGFAAETNTATVSEIKSGGLAAGAPLSPGPNDGRIAFVVARMLEQGQYSQYPFDEQISEKFFDRYLETLDPQHMHFLQSDIAEFDHYRTNLDQLTLTRKGVGDTTPAFEIFNRFMQRIEQRVEYATNILKNGKFEFNTDERMLLNRHEAPYPTDLNDAKRLWLQRLRYEYLQEKLGRMGAKNKADTSAKAKNKSSTNAIAATKSGEPSKEVKKKTDAEEIVELLTRRYNRIARMFHELDSDDVLERYLTALAHVYDPHSDYMNMRQAQNFSIQMNLSLYGIGAELGVTEEGYCKINRLLPGGPAAKSKKLKEQDRIVAVAQSNGPPVDIVDMGLDKAVLLIRGPKGSEVRLTVIPANGDTSQRHVVTLIRDKIPLEDQQAKAKIIDLPGADGKPLRFGIIDLPSFYTPMDLSGGGDASGRRFASADVAQLLEKLEKENVAGVIIDLRRNGGGSLEEAVKLTGLFIKEGPVVLVRGPNGDVTVDEDTDNRVVYEGPLILLTSRFTASASEIFAGALQDYGRALVVGDISTHGKGTVQKLNPLRQWVAPATDTATNDPGALKVTIRKFYRASGASTQLKGVMPDIVLPSVMNYSKDVGESALDNPMPWDTIPSARYEKINLVAPHLNELLKRSSERVATNQDFVYIREDIEQFRKNEADKTVSLNEQQRLKEKEENDTRQKARDKERLARKEPNQTVYELSLRQTDLPGLPPPVEKTNTLAKNFHGAALASESAKTAVSTGADAAVPATTSAEDEDEPAPPAVDATLDETEHVLADYISLLSQSNALTANH